jgi:prephenate dehydrogenase
VSSPHTVAVIGLGMIGGSVARALAAQGIRVVGHDVNSSYVDEAVAEGVVAERLDASLEELCGADAVVISVFGDAAVDVLDKISRHSANLRLVTDTGSTKRSIVAAAEDSPLSRIFVGAHPFAGDHRSGFSASRFDLFEGEICYLSPGPSSEQNSIAAAHDLWLSMGAKIVKIDAAEHDDLLAWTSHLPHLLSCTLALTLAHSGIAHRQLGRGGRDVTRLAAGSPDVWTSIALDNSEAIVRAISTLETELGSFRTALEKGARDQIRERFVKAREWCGPAR